jgi:hypothetical protein
MMALDSAVHGEKAVAVDLVLAVAAVQAGIQALASDTLTTGIVTASSTTPSWMIHLTTHSTIEALVTGTEARVSMTEDPETGIGAEEE